jgi:hypothetical protein
LQRRVIKGRTWAAYKEWEQLLERYLLYLNGPRETCIGQLLNTQLQSLAVALARSNQCFQSFKAAQQAGVELTHPKDIRTCWNS